MPNLEAKKYKAITHQDMANAIAVMIGQTDTPLRPTNPYQKRSDIRYRKLSTLNPHD